PEVRLAVPHVAIELDERSCVAELLRTLAREELPGLLVLRDRALRAVVLRLVAELVEPLELLPRRVVRPFLGPSHGRERTALRPCLERTRPGARHHRDRHETREKP